MSANAENLEVHIANEIQIRSDLLLAVDAATEYFLRKSSKHSNVATQAAAYFPFFSP